MSLKATVYNVGYLGIGNFQPKTHNEIYIKWKSMLRRCYSKANYLKSYNNCYVSEDWLNFQNFALWCINNNFNNNYHLDKDILIKGNKIYSADTCSFVPKEINLLFLKSQQKRGEFPIGVSKNLVGFRATLNSKIFLGNFQTAQEAFEKYKFEKEKYIKEIANLWKDKISEKVYLAMINYRVEITD